MLVGIVVSIDVLSLCVSSSGYCHWMNTENSADMYCWAMGEWSCVDETCGYSDDFSKDLSKLDRPRIDCQSAYPAEAKAKPNVYSCGSDKNQKSGYDGVQWWPDAVGCHPTPGHDTLLNPVVHGGELKVYFIELPFLKEGGDEEPVVVPEEVCAVVPERCGGGGRSLEMELESWDDDEPKFLVLRA